MEDRRPPDQGGRVGHRRGRARGAYAVARPRPLRGAGARPGGAGGAPTPPDESWAITWMPKDLELLDRLGLGERFDSCCSRAWKFGLRWLVNGRAV